MNLAFALNARTIQLWIGAAGLLCFWSMAIGAIVFLRDQYVPVVQLFIDCFAVAFFYRLAERDNITNERHDWAGLICIIYVALVLIDVRGFFVDFSGEIAGIVTANILFVLTVVINLAPSVALTILHRRILITI